MTTNTDSIKNQKLGSLAKFMPKIKTKDLLASQKQQF